MSFSPLRLLLRRRRRRALTQSAVPVKDFCFEEKKAKQNMPEDIFYHSEEETMDKN